MARQSTAQMTAVRQGSARQRAILKLPDTICASVLNKLKADAPSRVARVEFTGAKPVEIGIASDVLYVPALHLPVWRERIVPIEANADDDAYLELQRAAWSGQLMAHALFTNVEEWDEDVCVLSNLYSHNFYHFLEELYKVVILERGGFTGKYLFSPFPSRLAQEAPAFTRELLNLLAIAPERIVQVSRPTMLRAAWFTSRISHVDTLQYPGVFFALRNALRAAVSGPSLGRRLWLDRQTSRVLVNQQEVHDCLHRHDFTILDMAELPVDRQIAAAMQAEVLAGPHGAALIHSMFLDEGSTVIECFSPAYVNFHILEVAANLRHRYIQMVPTNTEAAPYPHHGDVAVDCRHLRLVLQQL